MGEGVTGTASGDELSRWDKEILTQGRVRRVSGEAAAECRYKVGKRSYEENLKAGIEVKINIIFLWLWNKYPEANATVRLIRSSTIHNDPNPEVIQVSKSKWLDRQTVIHLHTGILRGFTKKQNPAIFCYMDASGEYQAE